jgi:hypothetical protein
MWAPRFAEPPHQLGVAGFEKDQLGAQVLVGLQLAVGAREVADESRLAHVHDHRHAVVFALAFAQLGQHRQQRHRQIVDAVVAEVLEGANRL